MLLTPACLFFHSAQIILEFPPGSRFWPRDAYLLRSVTYPHWRFYNMVAIRGEECDILVAHLPPPHSLQLESTPLREVQHQLMVVLRDALSTERNGGPKRAVPAQSRPREVVDEPPVGYVSEELQCEDSSDEDDHVLQQRREERLRQFAARREERARARENKAAARADKAWQSRPVVLPIRMHITKW